MTLEDKSIQNLLELDGIRYVIDEHVGLWVKFEAKKVTVSKEKPHGIKYSLTLHDRSNKRIMGFDNAHPATDNSKKNAASKKVPHDHWHRNHLDTGTPYKYINTHQLLEDFWKAVDKTLQQLEEAKK